MPNVNDIVHSNCK